MGAAGFAEIWGTFGAAVLEVDAESYRAISPRDSRLGGKVRVGGGRWISGLALETSLPTGKRARGFSTDTFDPAVTALLTIALPESNTLTGARLHANVGWRGHGRIGRCRCRLRRAMRCVAAKKQGRLGRVVGFALPGQLCEARGIGGGIGLEGRAAQTGNRVGVVAVLRMKQRCAEITGQRRTQHRSGVRGCGDGLGGRHLGVVDGQLIEAFGAGDVIDLMQLGGQTRTEP